MALEVQHPAVREEHEAVVAESGQEGERRPRVFSRLLPQARVQLEEEARAMSGDEGLGRAEHLGVEAVGVDLENEAAPGNGGRGALHFGRRQPARAAPGRPEVHQHRHLRLPQDVVEQQRVGVDRFGHGLQDRFARAAPHPLRQMGSSDPVLLPAIRADSNHPGNLARPS